MRTGPAQRHRGVDGVGIRQSLRGEVDAGNSRGDFERDIHWQFHGGLGENTVGVPRGRAAGERRNESALRRRGLYVNGQGRKVIISTGCATRTFGEPELLRK